jgi:FkbM family methyltransferase
MDKFEYVIAFEPMVEHYECLIENTANRQNVSAFNYALGDANSTLFMTQHFENSGMSKVSDTVTDILVEQYTLDSVYNYQFGPIDFIKIDAEGHEPRILLGAERTIISHKPVICIEILPNAGPEVYSILLGLGYRVVAQVECNYIFKHSQECQ